MMICFVSVNEMSIPTESATLLRAALRIAVSRIGGMGVGQPAVYKKGLGESVEEL